MPTENDAFDSPLNPDHTHKIAAILSIIPDDSQPLTQFSREQLEAYLWAVKWLHDFNLGRMPKPGFSDEVLGRLSGFHETQMSEYLRQKEPAAREPTEEPTDSLAEWSQRALAGMKRMATDPEYRASIEQRLSWKPCQGDERMMPAPANTNADPEQIDGPAAPLPVDPEAEWNQQILRGLNRMDTDPEFRASVEKRLS